MNVFAINNRDTNGGVWEMRMIEVKCCFCGKYKTIQFGHYNRSIKTGCKFYCDKKCFGMSRRTNKSIEQKKFEKREYDKQYRSLNKDKLKESKAAYHKKTYDPIKAAIGRKKRMPQHVEYCRRPEYKKYKKEYDRKYRAKKFYGDFADAFLALLDLENEVKTISSKTDIAAQNGILNKKQTRRRDYEKVNSNQP